MHSCCYQLFVRLDNSEDIWIIRSRWDRHPEINGEMINSFTTQLINLLISYPCYVRHATHFLRVTATGKMVPNSLLLYWSSNGTISISEQLNLETNVFFSSKWKIIKLKLLFYCSRCSSLAFIEVHWFNILIITRQIRANFIRIWLLNAKMKGFINLKLYLEQH